MSALIHPGASFPVLKTDWTPMKRLRRSQGVSMRELAAQTGISYTQIWRVESGRCVPTVDRALAFSRALGVPMYHLFEVVPQ